MLFRETLIGPRWLAVAGASTLVFLAVITANSAPVVVGNVEEIDGWVVALLVAAFILILGAGLIGLDSRIRVSVSATHIDAHLSLFRIMHIPVSVWLTLTNRDSRVIRTDHPEELKKALQSMSQTLPT
ncbi:MAG: hypothetical protein JF592_08635 [Microbacterium sp.]|uniref:hypothetical protein n=1 Tax=Microbacterium sp. TaxID=51671 RepID=UPI001DF63E5F|nr:hypothetical protein [Microbacterium sp.]MBW8762640.1 hypothetical protein [Microbacterium sp.]